MNEIESLKEQVRILERTIHDIRVAYAEGHSAAYMCGMAEWAEDWSKRYSEAMGLK